VDDDLPRTDAPGVARHRDPAHDVATDAADAGQREAEFAAFYRTEAGKLVGFVMNAAGANHHDAADAAQNALMQGWTVWDALTNPRAWVRTVAIRQFYRSVPKREIPTDTPRSARSWRPRMFHWNCRNRLRPPTAYLTYCQPSNVLCLRWAEKVSRTKKSPASLK
jgi:hypothetical protein